MTYLNETLGNSNDYSSLNISELEIEFAGEVFCVLYADETIEVDASFDHEYGTHHDTDFETEITILADTFDSETLEIMALAGLTKEKLIEMAFEMIEN